MAVLESLFSGFRRSRTGQRKTRRACGHRALTEALEPRLLLTNPDPLESNPGAPVTIYLDFDGHVENSAAWNNNRVGNRPVDTPVFSLDNDRTQFSVEERVTIEEIFLRVAEDFKPFGNVNVTTIEPGSFQVGEAIRVSIGGYGNNHPQSGGDWWSHRNYNDALKNGFTDANLSTTVFVFARDYQSHPATSPSGRDGQIGRDIANGVSEAVGIALGLDERQSPNKGNNEVSSLESDDAFAVGLRDTWFNTPDRTGAAQDDIAEITRPVNSIFLIADDHGDTFATATPIQVTTNIETAAGTIGSNSDVDRFQFSTAATTATITVRGLDLSQHPSSLFPDTFFSDFGVTNAGSNLDPVLRLFDANGVELALDDQPFVINDNNSLTATITAALPAGNYYLEVGNGGRYGSLGDYDLTITGVDQPFSHSVPALQSNPGAGVTFFLDFNGHVVNNSEIYDSRADGISRSFFVPVYDTDGDRTTFSAQETAEINEIFSRVAEDFAPFDVNVTTQDPFLYDNFQGLLVAVGGDGSWLGPAGTVGTGFAVQDTFNSGTGDNNAVVFQSNFGSPKQTALETSFMIGQTLGIEPYIDHAAGGTSRVVGQPALGPIGGDSAASLRDTWLQGEGLTAGVSQDPLTEITSAKNRISYRRDDHSDSPSNATIVNVTVNDEVLTGIIEENNDEDWFVFQTLDANAVITVKGLDLTVDSTGASTGISNPGANLDPFIELLEDLGGGNLRQVAIDGDFPPNLDLNDADPASLQASVSAMLPPGRYFLRVGTRVGDYGNLGQYTITMEGVDGTPAVVSFRPDPNAPAVSAISENDGLVPLIGRVDRPFGQPTTVPLVVSLVSTDTTELTVPAQVTIPPGQSFVLFDVTAVDDTLLDGDQNVEVQAYVDGRLNSTATLKVRDHETISATVTPNPVKENAGPAAAVLTVTRSNTDIGAANHWVSYGDILEERDPSGAVLRQIPVEWPVGVRPVADVVHDVQVMQDGNIAIYNGTSRAFVSVYNVTTGVWDHFTTPGLDATGSSDPTNGGTATIGDYVFLTDAEVFDGDPRGIVRVNTVTGEVDRFADKSVGSRLFIQPGDTIFEIDPVAGDIVNQITPIATLSVSDSLEAVAFDGQFLWALFSSGSFGSSGSSINELQKLDPDTGDVLEVHSVPLPRSSFFFVSSSIGMTALNGKLYFNLPFDLLFGFGSRAIQAYDPVTRQLVGGLISAESLNLIVSGSKIGAIKGDPVAGTRDALLLYGYPNVFGAGVFSDDRVYFIDPETGRAFSSFGVSSGLGFRADAGIAALDDVIIGNTVRNGLIYVNGSDFTNPGIRLFDRNGNIVDVDPSTSFPDPVPHAVFPGFVSAELAGADVPGVTAQDLSFRDVTVGISDDLLYGLLENGSQIAVYHPENLTFERNIQLDASVSAIAVDEDGRIFGGGSDGSLRYFDADGRTIAILDTSSLGLAAVADVDTNISEEIIVSDVNGVVVSGPRQAVFDNDASVLITDSANAGTVTYAAFGRNPVLPTGPITVTLTSDDISELIVPVEARIPVGQSSTTVLLDAVDDHELDGPQSVTVSGASPNYVSDSTTVTVLDAESVGVEVQRETLITIEDVSLLADGDRFVINVNDTRTVFEIDDLAVGNGIAASSHFAVQVDLSTAITAEDVAVALASRIGTAGIGVSVAQSGATVTLGGNPYFPSVREIVGNAAAVTVLKPVAETEGLLPGRVRVYRTDLRGPFTVASSTQGQDSVAKEIEDNDVILATIDIPRQVSVITDVNVTLSLQHQFIPDLDIFLVSPSGTRVELVTDLRSNETRMTNTTFDDEAGRRIVDGVAPYSGRFIPEQLLSAFDGEDPSGTWTLEVVDDNVGDLGTLLNWSLDIQTLGISATTLTLVTTDDTEAVVTSQVVTIPPARSEVFVDLTVLDDSEVDGTVPVDVRVNSANVAGLFDLGSDEIDVTDVETLTIELSSTEVSEGAGAGALTATITRSDSELTDPLTVNLASSDDTELSVPSFVVIPAGSPSVSVQIDAVDDTIFDGDQMVVISASAAGYQPAVSDVITVLDQEPRLRMTTVSTSVPEDAGTITITLARVDATDLSQPQLVTLTSSDVTELTVPSTYVIGIGSVSTSFTATILEDDLLDGPQTVTITAADPDTANPRVNSGTLDIVVEDAEFVSITVPQGQERLLENEGPAARTATVSVSTANTHTSDLVVTLTNSDPSEIAIPAQVIIPVGQTMTTFSIDAVNDDVIDHDQPVAITGQLAGYRDGVLNLVVGDHEPPVFTGPELITEDSTPTISWNAVPGATRYDLWVNDISRGINQLFRLDNLPADVTSFTPTQEIGVGRYRAWIRAYDDLEQPGFWSPAKNFRVRTRPVITSPTNNTIAAQENFPEIQWTTVVDTSSYDLWVDNLTTGQSQVIRERNLRTTSFASSLAALPGGTYKAWVRATAPDGFSGFWSRPLTFTVLAAPSITSPARATFDRTPTFEWTPVEGAANYFIWVTLRNPGEKPQVVLRDRFVPGTSFTPEQDLPLFGEPLDPAAPPATNPNVVNARYAVWVKAIAADGTESAWSQAHEFTIGGRPQFTGPADGSTTSSRPVFLWTRIEQAERYEFWMNRVDVPQSRVVYDANVNVTSFAVRTPLAPGTYRAWIRAFSDMGEASEWSRPVTFTVASADAPIGAGLSPLAGETDRRSGDEVAARVNHVAASYLVTPLIDDAGENDGIAMNGATTAEAPQHGPGGVQPEDAESAGVVDEAAAELDALMEDWGAGAYLTLESPESADGPPSALAAGMGLVAASATLKTGRRRRRQ